MNQYNRLLGRIAEEFHVFQGKTETETAWKSRIIYSLLGRMGYASLWDIREDLQPVSVVHFKNRIESMLESYLEMYPELRLFYPGDISELSNEIYNIFLCTGQVYHTSHRITPAIKAVSEKAGIYFLRGMPLDRKPYISGIGNYSFSEDEPAVIQPADMFQLPQNTLAEQWEYWVYHAKWYPLEVGNEIEFLRTKPPFTYSYWIEKPDISGMVSLARIGLHGNKTYFLYKAEAGRILGSQLPQWIISDNYYRTLSNGCLASVGRLPVSTYHVDGKIVQLRIHYLLPPAELNLIKLYSWPESCVDIPDDFNRIFDYQVFLAIKSILEPIGYTFIEE